MNILQLIKNDMCNLEKCLADNSWIFFNYMYNNANFYGLINRIFAHVEKLVVIDLNKYQQLISQIKMTIDEYERFILNRLVIDLDCIDINNRNWHIQQFGKFKKYIIKNDNNLFLISYLGDKRIINNTNKMVLVKINDNIINLCPKQIHVPNEILNKKIEKLNVNKYINILNTHNTTDA